MQQQQKSRVALNECNVACSFMLQGRRHRRYMHAWHSQLQNKTRLTRWCFPGLLHGKSEYNNALSLQHTQPGNRKHESIHHRSKGQNKRLRLRHAGGLAPPGSSGGRGTQYGTTQHVVANSGPNANKMHGHLRVEWIELKTARNWARPLHNARGGLHTSCGQQVRICSQCTHEEWIQPDDSHQQLQQTMPKLQIRWYTWRIPHGRPDMHGISETKHFAKVCRNKPQVIHEVWWNGTVECNHEPNNQTAEIDKLMPDLFVGKLKEANNGTPDLWFMDVRICDNVVHFKLDTRSEANVLPTRTYNKIWATPLWKSTCTLVTFSGHHINYTGWESHSTSERGSSSRWSLNVRPFWEKQHASNSKLLAQLDELAIDRGTEPQAATDEEQTASHKNGERICWSIQVV